MLGVSLDACRQVLPGQSTPACFPLQAAQHAQGPRVAGLQLQQVQQQLTALQDTQTCESREH